jgi:DNA polymerase type B, organellar and viral
MPIGEETYSGIITRKISAPTNKVVLNEIIFNNEPTWFNLTDLVHLVIDSVRFPLPWTKTNEDMEHYAYENREGDRRIADALDAPDSPEQPEIDVEHEMTELFNPYTIPPPDEWLDHTADDNQPIPQTIPQTTAAPPPPPDPTPVTTDTDPAGQYQKINFIDMPYKGENFLQTVCEQFLARIDAAQVGFQIESEIVYPSGHGLSKIRTVSDLYSHPGKMDPTTLLNQLVSYIYYLANRDGDTNYQTFYTKNWNNYKVKKVIIIYSLGTTFYGGCRLRGIQTPPDKILSCLHIYDKLEDDYPENDCFFDAVTQNARAFRYDISNADVPTSEVRRINEIPPKAPIFFKENQDEILIKLCAFYNINLHIWMIELDPAAHYNRRMAVKKSVITRPTYNHYIDIFYFARNRYGHYWSIRDMKAFEKLRSCSQCSEWKDGRNINFLAAHERECQKCHLCGLRVRLNHEETCKGKRQYLKRTLPVMNVSSKKPKSDGLSNVFFADFETVQLDNKQRVFSIAVVGIEDIEMGKTDSSDIIDRVVCEPYFGFDGMKLFIDDCLTMTGATIYFYNGSRFDFYFIYEYLVASRTTFQIMRHAESNRILSMTIGKNTMFKDLILFTECSLQDACKAYAVPPEYIKLNFDMSKMKTVEDIEKNAKEIMHYNKYDVIPMGFLYKFFNRLALEHGFLFSKFITAPQMYHTFWQSVYLPHSLRPHMKLPLKEEYEFTRRALYGGRTHPCTPYCITPTGSKVKTERWVELTNEERQQYVRNNLKNDHIVHLDVNSLYPSSCLVDFPCGNYYWKSRNDFLPFYALFRDYKECWRSIKNNIGHNAAYATVKRAILCVDVKCTNLILIPFLMSKDEKGNSVQDLCDKKAQCYDGPTLLHAIKLGYIITKIHDILYWTRSAPVLAPFMRHFHKKKQEAEKEGNVAQRTMNKSAMNGLTGKFSQKICNENFAVFYDDTAFGSQETFNQLKKIELIYNQDSILMAYGVTLKDLSKEPSKVNHLGVFILGRSRIIMSKFCKKIGKTIEYPLGMYENPDALFLYTDTDSLIVKGNYIRELPDHVKAKFLGDELGQFKDEHPDDIIIDFVGVAPKTYMFRFINIKNIDSPDYKPRLKAIIRHKGVPINRKLVNKRSGEMDMEVCYNSNLSTNIDDLGDVVYSICYKNTMEVIYSKNYIDFHDFKHMVKERDGRDYLVIVASFIRFERRLIEKDAASNAGVIRLTPPSSRTINKTSWWTSGKRVWDALLGCSLPKGHYVLLNE